MIFKNIYSKCKLVKGKYVIINISKKIYKSHIKFSNQHMSSSKTKNDKVCSNRFDKNHKKPTFYNIIVIFMYYIFVSKYINILNIILFVFYWKVYLTKRQNEHKK